MKLKYATLGIIAAISLAAAAYASAQTLPPPPARATSTVPAVNQIRRGEIRDFRTNEVRPTMQSIKEQRENMKGQSTSTKAQMRNVIKDERDALKEKRQALMEDLRKKLAEGLRLRILKSLEKLDDTLTRIENINGRIEQRIARIEASGVNPITVKDLLTVAKDQDVLARQAIQAARTAIASATISTSTDKNALKDTLEEAKQSVKDARTATVDAISALHGLGRASNNQFPATATATTTQ